MFTDGVWHKSQSTERETFCDIYQKSLPSWATHIPKPLRTAFICFVDNKKSEITKKEGITKDDDGLLRDVASAWKSLSMKELAYWDEEARNDKVRYVQERAAYRGLWNILKRRANED